MGVNCKSSARKCPHVLHEGTLSCEPTRLRVIRRGFWVGGFLKFGGGQVSFEFLVSDEADFDVLDVLAVDGCIAHAIPLPCGCGVTLLKRSPATQEDLRQSSHVK